MVHETDKSETVKIKLADKVECLHCHWKWRPQKESEFDENYAEVKICPRCKSLKWNIPKPSKKFRPDKKGLTPLRKRKEQNQLLKRSEKIQRRRNNENTNTKHNLSIFRL